MRASTLRARQATWHLHFRFGAWTNIHIFFVGRASTKSRDPTYSDVPEMARSRHAGVLSHSVCNASLLSSLRCFHSSTRYVSDHARVVDDLAASFADAYPSASTTSASVPASSASSSMPQYTYKRPHGVVQRAIQTILKQSPYTHAIPTMHYAVSYTHL